jgi:hypothetical protein
VNVSVQRLGAEAVFVAIVTIATGLVTQPGKEATRVGSIRDKVAHRRRP